MHPARRSLLSHQIDFEALQRSEERIGEAKKALNTREAYSLAWRAFCGWCETASLSPLPADPRVVKNFSTWCLEQGYRIRTVTLRLTGIAHHHREAGFLSPINKEVWQHIENAKRHYKEEPGGKHAITCDMLRRMLSRLPEDALGVRDRAIILVTFAAGWRKGETVSLRYSDARFVPSGLELWLRSSKTDQTGEGRLVGIQPGDNPVTCPVLALQAWLALRGPWDGALFTRLTSRRQVTRDPLGRRGQVIYNAVKKYSEAIGENPKFFGAHSLRAGMITECAKNGASESSIMQRTGHKSSATLRRYIRPASVFDFNPLKGIL